MEFYTYTGVDVTPIRAFTFPAGKMQGSDSATQRKCSLLQNQRGQH